MMGRSCATGEKQSNEHDERGRKNFERSSLLKVFTQQGIWRGKSHRGGRGPPFLGREWRGRREATEPRGGVGLTIKVYVKEPCSWPLLIVRKSLESDAWLMLLRMAQSMQVFQFENGMLINCSWRSTSKVSVNGVKSQSIHTSFWNYDSDFGLVYRNVESPIPRVKVSLKTSSCSLLCSLHVWLIYVSLESLPEAKRKAPKRSNQDGQWTASWTYAAMSQSWNCISNTRNSRSKLLSCWKAAPVTKLLKMKCILNAISIIRCLLLKSTAKGAE